MNKIEMTRLYNPEATYIAYGRPKNVGRDSQWSPGIGGRLFHSRTDYETLGKIGKGFLPRWLQGRLEEGLPMPEHFDVFGHGKGSIRAEELYTIT